jgi:cytochrome c oxidase assembly protein subunit 15
MAIWLWRAEPRRWVRNLGFIALGAVIVQGILGGITVLWYLPKPISISHAGLAQIVFCLTTTIALVTSGGWRRGYARAGSAQPDDRVLQKLAIVTTAAIYAQIIAGATMRHNGAGLAIPDFPWAFGQLVPPVWNLAIALNFAHRVGAVVVSLLLLATTAHVFYHHAKRPELARPSALLLVLLVAQITLGALTILSGKHYVINSLHVVTGGLVLVTSLVLTLRAHRARFAGSEAQDPAYQHGGAGRAFSTRRATA